MKGNATKSVHEEEEEEEEERGGGARRKEKREEEGGADNTHSAVALRHPRKRRRKPKNLAVSHRKFSRREGTINSIPGCRGDPTPWHRHSIK